MRLIVISIRDDGITVMGHSGYAPPGVDIVCAAVSVLTETLIRALAEEGGAAEIRLGDGRANVTFGKLSERAKGYAAFFARGAAGVAEAYPRYVRLCDLRNGGDANDGHALETARDAAAVVCTAERR